MRDGIRLAARIWLPHDAGDHPVPAILEYIPYRLSDFSAVADSRRHPYFAAHGYASVRVDVRGTGNSEGILFDEYLAQEQDDALDILEWIARQPWCDGKLGIIGISWGGFNALQIAARRPPQLQAIISIGSSDDRYGDDVHYMGGALLAATMLSWASFMLCINALPPDPRVVGERWRAMWQERLEQTPPYLHTWLAHPRRDAYWRHGSVGENYEDVACPVYAVGGWADAYTNSVLRLFEHLRVPRKGLIGPWAHDYAHEALPGPQLGFLQECVRWWDYWLKGIQNGIMDEPLLRVWMQESVAPRTFYAEMPGRWVSEQNYPSPNVTPYTYYLGTEGVVSSVSLRGAASPQAVVWRSEAATKQSQQEFGICSPQSTGLDAGEWCPHGYPGEMPGDQRADDSKSLVFDSPSLDAPMDILGFPELTLTLAANRPTAFVIGRLCDIAPDGSSLLISRGVLNLTHRDSHSEPTPLDPNRRYTVSFRLNAAGHSLPVGHRWRIALSTTYWHHIFPAPEIATVTVYLGSSSHLTLPVRAPRPEDNSLPPFDEPECAEPIASNWIRSPSFERKVIRDLTNDRVQFISRIDGGVRHLLDADTRITYTVDEQFTIDDHDPLSAQIRSVRMRAIEREDWQVRTETTSTMHGDAQNFYTTNRVEACEGDKRIFSRDYEFMTPRDLV